MLCTAAAAFLKSIYNYEFSDLGAQIKEKSPLRNLTEVAGEGGTDCPPQKFLLSSVKPQLNQKR